MSLHPFFRFSMWALLIGSAFDLINGVLENVIPGPLGYEGPPQPVFQMIGIVTALLLIVGLPVIYRVQAQVRQARVWSLVGVIVLIVVLLGVIVIYSTTLPMLLTSTGAAQDTNAGPPPFIFLLLIGTSILGIIGAICSGIGVLRAQVFPRTVAWLFFAGILNSASFFLGFFLQGQELLGTIVGALGTIALDGAAFWCALQLVRQPLPAQSSLVDSVEQVLR